MVFAVCLLVAGGLGYFKYQQIQAAIAFGAAFPETVESVELFIAREEIFQPTTSVTGEAVAIRTVEVSNELAGRIVEVGFTPGATVAANQVLVRLDTSEERAQLAAARADAELARLALERNQKLIRSGAAAEEARDRSKAEFDAANADVDRLLAIIDKKTLRAPFAARASLHELEPGQYLESATKVVRLIGIDEQIWIDFTLPQQQAELAIGESVEVTANRRTLQAQIIARDAFVNDQSRNVRFRALAHNQSSGSPESDGGQPTVIPGSLVTVVVPAGPEQRATLVPMTAVRRDAFGANVYVLQPAEEGARAPDRAERRTVTLGPQRGDLVVVTSGIRPGERIAANGAFKLRDRVLVRPVTMDPMEIGQLDSD
jgi:membrane fusion protein (multidrug efflux system)